LRTASTGAFAVSGILAALLTQRLSGEGQFVDVLDEACLSVSGAHSRSIVMSAEPVARGRAIALMRFSPILIPTPTSDGRSAIGAAGHEDWVALLHVMWTSDLAQSENLHEHGLAVRHTQRSTPT